ncbi:septum formation family protein [Nocardiopsis ganjiahuensis]|uniref:septum formation family protein n=1 Tax=Nocardiopsis ganjiahuensis TaxID=239984 RepID=UPI000349486A|nr:septum formation family protein [Nocardiopsis ganjiahuensis]
MLSEARHPLPGRIALATVAAGAALSLSACGLPLLPPAFSGGGEEPVAVTEPEPTEPEEPVETEEPEPVEAETEEPFGPEDQDVAVLVVGDCLNEMEVGVDDSVSTVPIVDCSEPHDLEVYHGGALDSDLDYPGREAVIELVDEGCYEVFETFVGTPVEESSLIPQTLFPMEDGWEQGDRDYLCLVGQDGEQTTGSLEGSSL